MEQRKHAVKSVTIWGALIAMSPVLLSLFGYDLSQADADGLAAQVDAIVVAIGSIIAIIGRLRANKKVVVK